MNLEDEFDFNNQLNFCSVRRTTFPTSYSWSKLFCEKASDQEGDDRMTDKIKITKKLSATPQRVYDAYMNPADLIQWYSASEGWTTPYAEIEAVPGGKFKIRFEDPTGKNSFDYEGVFSRVETPSLFEQQLGDDRVVLTQIKEVPGGCEIVQEFDADDVYPLEYQAKGWLAILDNLERYLAEEKSSD